MLRSAILEPENLTSFAVTPLIYEHHIADATIAVDVLYPTHELPVVLLQSPEVGIARTAGQVKLRWRARRLQSAESRETYSDDSAFGVGAVFRHIQRAEL